MGTIASCKNTCVQNSNRKSETCLVVVFCICVPHMSDVFWEGGCVSLVVFIKFLKPVPNILCNNMGIYISVQL